jgi:hypothetical protein
MEIDRYHIDDPRHFRVYERTHDLRYTPFVVLDNVLGVKDVEDILTILNSHSDSIRNLDEIKELRPPIHCKSISHKIPELDRYDDVIVDRCMQTNRNTWNLDISCFMDRRHLLYEPGADTAWHFDGPFGVIGDTLPDDVLWRKLSATVCLNDDYEGGEFEMIQSSNPEDSYVKIKPSAGSVIVFPPFIKHRVAPVISGRRITLIYWFCGPRWR